MVQERLGDLRGARRGGSPGAVARAAWVGILSSLVILALAAGCGQPQPAGDAGGPMDAGGDPDAGGEPDAGSEPDAGGEPDAGVPEDAGDEVCTADADCDDGLYCNGEERCDPTLGCVGGARPAGDGIDCTFDGCDEELDMLIHIPVDEICDDGDLCDGAERCDLALGCQPGSPLPADDGVACTVDACDPATGAISHTPDDSLCDDALFCNGAERCDAALGCQPGADPSDDGVPCTTDSCDEAADTVSHAPVDAACDDALFCNGAERCDAALGCQPGADPSDDGVACTVDSCEEATDTVGHTPADAACDDADYCNGAESCDAALGCQPGTPVSLPAVEASDTFGHQAWSSGLNPTICPHTFIDISSTPALFSGDDVLVGVPLGGTGFALYGESSGVARVDSNGWLTISAGGSSTFGNACGPGFGFTGSREYAFALHDDLVANGVYHQYYAACPRPHPIDPSRGCNLIQWDARHYTDPGDPIGPSFDFEVFLYEGGEDLVFAYGAGNAEAGLESTTGILGGSMSDFIQWSCNTAGSVPENSSVCIFGPTGCP